MNNTIALKKMTKALSEVQHRLPALVGAEAVKFSKESFTKQGWQGATFERWSKRSPSARKNKGRAILIDSGRMRRSVRVIRQSSASVTIGTDVPYAAAHNYGYRGTVTVQQHQRNKYKKTRVSYIKNGKERTRTTTSVSSVSTVSAHTRKMNIPRRQFIGDSPYLRQRLTRVVAAEIMKAAKRI